MKIYAASSWKNQYQPEVVKALRMAGHEVYDFRNPKPGGNGFHWSEIDPNWQDWTAAEYREGLKHPIAEAGYQSDLEAMEWAEVFIGIMPFGRSASMEMGWAAGMGKKTILYIPERIEPELMVKMFDRICVDTGELLAVLKELRIKNEELRIDDPATLEYWAQAGAKAAARINKIAYKCFGDGAMKIAGERLRQIKQKGYTAAHDMNHKPDRMYRKPIVSRMNAKNSRRGRGFTTRPPTESAFGIRIEESGCGTAKSVCTINRRRGMPFDKKTDQANGRLIEAAPEMYKLLKELHEWFKARANGQPEPVSSIAAAMTIKLILKKVRGEKS